MKLEMVPIGMLFRIYLVGNVKKKMKLIRKLYGYNDRSFYGKYTYKRKGILSSIAYIKTKKSTVIIKREDSKLLKNFLTKNNIKFSEHLIFLHENEAKKLGIFYPHKWQYLIEDLKGSPNLLVTVDF